MSHFCFPPRTPFRGCWKSVASAAYDLILGEVGGKHQWKCQFVADRVYWALPQSWYQFLLFEATQCRGINQTYSLCSKTMFIVLAGGQSWASTSSVWEGRRWSCKYEWSWEVQTIGPWLVNLGDLVVKCNYVLLAWTEEQCERFSFNLRLPCWRGKFCDIVYSLRPEFLKASCIS